MNIFLVNVVALRWFVSRLHWQNCPYLGYHRQSPVTCCQQKHADSKFVKLASDTHTIKLCWSRCVPRVPCTPCLSTWTRSFSSLLPAIKVICAIIYLRNFILLIMYHYLLRISLKFVVAHSYLSLLLLIFSNPFFLFFYFFKDIFFFNL